jgi:hypothetical protein
MAEKNPKIPIIYTVQTSSSRADLLPIILPHIDRFLSPP